MAYCINCGNELIEGAKFCSNCGTAVGKELAIHKSDYSGEIHKCPNCGETLAAFLKECPACGYELRGAKTSVTVRQFTESLENAENDEQRIVMLRNFPIPNTKEDIFEFFILAATNIKGEESKAVFESWLAKFEQCYQKAKLIMGADSDFEKVQTIYDKTKRSVSKEKAVHGVKTAKRLVSQYFAFMPNPIFAIVVIFVAVFAIIRLVKGEFAGIDIIFDAIILGATYKITTKKKQEE